MLHLSSTQRWVLSWGSSVHSFGARPFSGSNFPSVFAENNIRSKGRTKGLHLRGASEQGGSADEEFQEFSSLWGKLMRHQNDEKAKHAGGSRNRWS